MNNQTPPQDIGFGTTKLDDIIIHMVLSPALGVGLEVPEVPYMTFPLSWAAMGLMVRIEMGTHTLTLFTHIPTLMDMEPVEGVFFQTGDIDIDTDSGVGGGGELFSEPDRSTDPAFPKDRNGLDGGRHGGRIHILLSRENLFRYIVTERRGGMIQEHGTDIEVGSDRWILYCIELGLE
jgi:hypothetical protein